MRALRVTALDGPDALELGDAPEPEAGEGVLIDVEAAGVAFPDLLLTRGEYQLKPEPPFVPGAEIAGTVRSAGEGTGFSAGDRVMAVTLLNGFAERASSPPHLTFPIPESFSTEQAAGFVLNYHTAHFALRHRGRLREGETVLVHGAAGGVGTATIQVAKGSGARVTAVVSSDVKEDVARRAGADEVVRSDGDWRGEVKRLTDGRGVDVVMDPVGGDRFGDSLRSLAPEGRLLVVGFAEGEIPTVSVNRLLLRNVDLVGVAWGAFVMDKPDLCREIAEDLERMAAGGAVDPIVDDVYPLEDGARAVRQLDERGALGKIVLRVAN
ncbi:MAG: Alcohol dehydrogenase [uncultured Solirubrobacterales bacterium]|uniref:Alcohol dehydrogenase n=1 Tax=uncultured Solirubrobacterales bacterium TaxID=768556 RepID=A0A6J4T6G8_9ACTN|nr:MAG: Alcohol dehydrogenase [uncultured Solirubrobacterales bacterium]